MNKKKIPLAFLATLFLFGCANKNSPTKSWEMAAPTKTEIKEFKSYEKNKKITSYVGNSMIYSTYTEGEYYYKPSKNVMAWRNRNIEAPNKTGKKAKWQPKYIYPGKDGDYVLTSKSYYDEAIGIIVNENGSIPKDPVMRIDKRGSEKRYPITPYELNLFELDFMPTSKKSTHTYELIYSGKSASTINITYREYSGNLIREAFIQNLSYDLNESNVIQFKNTRIQILKATNTDITFKVLSSGK